VSFPLAGHEAVFSSYLTREALRRFCFRSNSTAGSAMSYWMGATIYSLPLFFYLFGHRALDPICCIELGLVQVDLLTDSVEMFSF
jgi:hypothetical protein